VVDQGICAIVRTFALTSFVFPLTMALALNRLQLGTPSFMAPELFEGKYTETVDVYSFGMCMIEMVTRRMPYDECSNPAQLYKKVTAGTLPDAFNCIRHECVREFIQFCVSRLPDGRRPSAAEVESHPFLDEHAPRPEDEDDELCHTVAPAAGEGLISATPDLSRKHSSHSLSPGTRSLHSDAAVASTLHVSVSHVVRHNDSRYSAVDGGTEATSEEELYASSAAGNPPETRSLAAGCNDLADVNAAILSDQDIGSAIAAPADQMAAPASGASADYFDGAGSGGFDDMLSWETTPGARVAAQAARTTSTTTWASLSPPGPHSRGGSDAVQTALRASQSGDLRPSEWNSAPLVMGASSPVDGTRSPDPALNLAPESTLACMPLVPRSLSGSSGVLLEGVVDLTADPSADSAAHTAVSRGPSMSSSSVLRLRNASTPGSFRGEAGSLPPPPGYGVSHGSLASMRSTPRRQPIGASSTAYLSPSSNVTNVPPPSDEGSLFLSLEILHSQDDGAAFARATMQFFYDVKIDADIVAAGIYSSLSDLTLRIDSSCVSMFAAFLNAQRVAPGVVIETGPIARLGWESVVLRQLPFSMAPAGGGVAASLSPLSTGLPLRSSPTGVANGMPDLVLDSEADNGLDSTRQLSDSLAAAAVDAASSCTDSAYINDNDPLAPLEMHSTDFIEGAASDTRSRGRTQRHRPSHPDSVGLASFVGSESGGSDFGRRESSTSRLSFSGSLPPHVAGGSLASFPPQHSLAGSRSGSDGGDGGGAGSESAPLGDDEFRARLDVRSDAEEGTVDTGHLEEGGAVSDAGDSLLSRPAELPDAETALQFDATAEPASGDAPFDDRFTPFDATDSQFSHMFPGTAAHDRRLDGGGTPLPDDEFDRGQSEQRAAAFVYDEGVAEAAPLIDFFPADGDASDPGMQLVGRESDYFHQDEPDLVFVHEQQSALEHDVSAPDGSMAEYDIAADERGAEGMGAFAGIEADGAAPFIADIQAQHVVTQDSLASSNVQCGALQSDDSPRLAPLEALGIERPAFTSSLPAQPLRGEFAVGAAGFVESVSPAGMLNAADGEQMLSPAPMAGESGYVDDTV
jgi:hypothetical protein